jgi:hypothetical protein
MKHLIADGIQIEMHKDENMDSAMYSVIAPEEFWREIDKPGMDKIIIRIGNNVFEKIK